MEMNVTDRNCFNGTWWVWLNVVSIGEKLQYCIRLNTRKVEYLLKGTERRRRLSVLDTELLSYFAKNAESGFENETLYMGENTGKSCIKAHSWK
jgi:hypothetical protein